MTHRSGKAEFISCDPMHVNASDCGCVMRTDTLHPLRPTTPLKSTCLRTTPLQGKPSTNATVSGKDALLGGVETGAEVEGLSAGGVALTAVGVIVGVGN